MSQTLNQCLEGILRPGMTLGIIGMGAFGQRVRDIAEGLGIRMLLCDPPRSMDDVDELDGFFQQQWGNGMGGCQLDNSGLETYLPMECLTAADVIAIQVPLTRDGAWPTANMLTAKFLSACRPDVLILCFSAPEVISIEVSGDSRIRLLTVVP